MKLLYTHLSTSKPPSRGRKGVVPFILILLCALPSLADAVTTSANLTLFGHIEKMDASEVVLQARFPSSKGVETKNLSIPRAQVVRIEFNATTFNPGSPPGLRPGPPPQSASAAREDTVVQRGGQPISCQGATIDSASVHCGKRVMNRALVVRVLLGRT